MPLLISLIIASRLRNVTNVFRMNVIVVGQNINQLWNISHLVHPFLSYLFTTIIRVLYVLKQNFKSKYAS